jgi:hypothetical protein
MEFDTGPQALSWFRDRYLEGSLDIRPPYQRRPVWGAKQKCALIESILMNLPVPELYMQQIVSAEGDTTYAIVDGQQRTRTVLQFIGAEQDPEEQEFNRFPLDKLPATSPWYGKMLAELDPDDRRRFFGYRFAVRYLNTDRDDEVRDMFKRLNEYQSPLTPQELRNAMFTGPFVKFVTTLADDEYWAENRVVTPAGIRRMIDIQFVSELVIGLLHGPQAGSPRAIDDYYQEYEDYESEFPGQKTVEPLYAATRDVVERLFPEIRKTRWANMTDFYSVFVAIGHVLRSRDKPLAAREVRELRDSLASFAEIVSDKQADDDLKVPRHVSQYVRGLQRGANDKTRRSARHTSLLTVIDEAIG